MKQTSKSVSLKKKQSTKPKELPFLMIDLMMCVFVLKQAWNVTQLFRETAFLGSELFSSEQMPAWMLRLGWLCVQTVFRAC